VSDSWKLTLPCTRAEAEALDFDDVRLAAIEPTPVLMTREETEDDPDDWRLDAYFETKPGKGTIEAVRALVPSARDAKPMVERIAEQDWVTLSQAGIEPVHAGRFYVHTDTNRGDVPAGAKSFRIDAGRAFGTGTHETTAGCLQTLDAMRRRGERFGDVLDVGTGTGLLTFAALHLWPQARAVASDIDPVAVDVSRENAAINGVKLGRGPGRLTLVAASGVDHPAIASGAPYDLVIANILAGPLIELAPGIGAAVVEGGSLVVAGLLDRQAGDVARAYRAHGFRLAGRVDNGHWPSLRFIKRSRYAPDRVRRRGGKGEAPGFGSW
jgi:ribosomal protein L11 methyltransferase